MGVYGNRLLSDWSAPASGVAEGKMNAVIAIIDLSGPKTPYDPITNTGGSVVPRVVWQGKARIQQIYTARGSNIDGDSTRNPTGQRTILFNIPLKGKDAYKDRIERGWQIKVIDPGKDPSLVEYTYHVDSAVNSSWAAARTIAASMDAEASPGWE